MISKKVCLIGAFGVGKTSLVRRFVTSLFDDKYLTTVGVRVDRKDLTCDGKAVTLVLWDLAGEDGVTRLSQTYLRGMAGYLLVIDGTRRATAATALKLQREIQAGLGVLPFRVLVNKVDLGDQWELQGADLVPWFQLGVEPILTSAKTGAAVEDAFLDLTRDLLNTDSPS
jgi:small GTP-binding protein